MHSLLFMDKLNPLVSSMCLLNIDNWKTAKLLLLKLLLIHCLLLPPLFVGVLCLVSVMFCST